jgi:hypothetical protein
MCFCVHVLDHDPDLGVLCRVDHQIFLYVLLNGT